MTTTEILPDLFFIERGYLTANHFAYRGDEVVLIDSGYRDTFAETAQHLRALEIDLTHVRRIINTHTHCDHVGGNQVIQERSGCQIWLHQIGKHFVERGDTWAMWQAYLNQPTVSFMVTHALSEGDSVNVGPYRFQLIYTPGHAADGIALYQPESRLLISADALWEHDVPMLLPRVEGSATLFRLLDSLDKLAALQVDMVYPGHGSAFADMHQAIARSRQRVERYLQEPLELGRATLKKIIMYVLLMHQPIAKTALFERLQQTIGFTETVAFYHMGQPNTLFDAMLTRFMERDLIRARDGLLRTTVKP